MSDSEIRPALTAEEWRNRPSNEDDEDRANCIIGHLAEGQERFHAAAATALYGQPYGFTRADLEVLREAMYFGEDIEEAKSLHARIAALLPPEPS